MSDSRWVTDSMCVPHRPHSWWVSICCAILLGLPRRREILELGC